MSSLKFGTSGLRGLVTDMRPDVCARYVRAFLRPDHLLTVDIRAVAEQKRRALNCYASQFTNFYPWQRRPAVDPILIDQVVAGPEVFLAYDPSPKGMAIFARGQALAQGVIWFHRITPALKRLTYAFVR